MKKMFLTLTLIISCMEGIAQNATIKSLPIGSSIPMAKEEFASVNDKTISLEKMRGKNGLLVMFSCNTCPYVIKSQPRTREMMAYAAERGIGMVIINSNEGYRNDEDSPEAMAAYAEKQEYKVPYVIDEKSKLADAFGATRTPEVYLFDATGKLLYKGAMEDNPANPSESKQLFLKNAIDHMLAGASIDPNSTKSIGCSIKRTM